MSIARNTDPRTSLQGEHQTNRLSRKKDQSFLLGFILMNPRKTRKELCQLLIARGHSYCRVSTLEKRISDLHQAGLTREYSRRKCSESNCTAATWVVT